MNERIKELAKQAFIYSCEFAHGPDYSPHNPYNELIEKERYDTKFAQLIVIKCLDIVDKKVSGMVGVAAMKEIEEYFGVKE